MRPVNSSVIIACIVEIPASDFGALSVLRLHGLGHSRQDYKGDWLIEVQTIHGDELQLFEMLYKTLHILNRICQWMGIPQAQYFNPKFFLFI